MAYNINESFKNELPFLPKVYIYLRINRLEKILRKIIFIFNVNILKKNTSINEQKSFNEIVNIENFLKYKDELETKNYAYIENFFSEEFFKYVIDNWPKKYLFRPPFGLDKFYDTGFVFKKNEKVNLGTDKISWLKDLYKFFNSDKFVKALKEFSNFDLYFESSGLNQTRTGSYIALHLDDVDKDDKLFGSLNCIIILDSSETGCCANLSLGKSNRWEDIYFKSPNKKNSALIYRIGSYHYHGFKPVKKNEYRKALNVRFLREN